MEGRMDSTPTNKHMTRRKHTYTDREIDESMNGWVDVQTKNKRDRAWTNFSLQDEPWAEYSTLQVAACIP